MNIMDQCVKALKDRRDWLSVNGGINDHVSRIMFDHSSLSVFATVESENSWIVFSDDVFCLNDYSSCSTLADILYAIDMVLSSSCPCYFD